MNVQQLIDSGANVNITVTAVDLREFAMGLIEEVRRMETAMRKVDKELTLKETAEQLGVSANSLWRWKKRGYLVPAAMVGRKPIYLQSQIDAMKKAK